MCPVNLGPGVQEYSLARGSLVRRAFPGPDILSWTSGPTRSLPDDDAGVVDDSRRDVEEELVEADGCCSSCCTDRGKDSLIACNTRISLSGSRPARATTLSPRVSEKPGLVS